jgi:hypothetical protein
MTQLATIRGTVADGADGECIGRLAGLAGSTAPEGAVLLAEVQGEPVAAIGLFDGRVISDPRRATFALRMRLQVLRLQLRLIAAICSL